jgi:SpoVK/Ycf46/Vps4 family AAA+-type ATPase
MILPEIRELDSMVGLVAFKRTIMLQIVYFLQGLDRNANGNVVDYKHMVLCGPPGVGKTEVAKTVGRLFLAMGCLSSNVFKKATRSDLVGGYLGQTAIKTAAVIQSCLGGVLFIDEAYSLWDNGRDKQDAYAREAIDTLCEAMSCHKADLMVIIAGYQQEIEEFLNANRGLESRFLWRHVLEPLTAEELAVIFDMKVAESGWKRQEGSWVSWFTKNKAEFSGSGRCIEKLLSFVKMSHAKRVFGKETTREITVEDRNEGFALFLEQKGEKKPNSHQFYFV